MYDLAYRRVILPSDIASAAIPNYEASSCTS